MRRNSGRSPVKAGARRMPRATPMNSLRKQLAKRAARAAKRAVAVMRIRAVAPANNTLKPAAKATAAAIRTAEIVAAAVAAAVAVPAADQVSNMLKPVGRATKIGNAAII